MRSVDILRTSIKRADSGSSHNSKGTLRIGKIPPKMNTARQPKCGISEAATNPPAPEPKLKPVNMIVSSSERLRDGTYSERSVVEFGIAAPRPRPVKKRSVTSCTGESAKAQI